MDSNNDDVRHATIVAPVATIRIGQASPGAGMPLATALAAGLVPQEILARMNCGCPFCKVIYLVDPNNLENVPPDAATAPGGWLAFKAHLAACMAAHTEAAA